MYFFSPVIQEESVLYQNVQDEIDKALYRHERHILSHKVPAEGIQTEVLTWDTRYMRNSPTFTSLESTISYVNYFVMQLCSYVVLCSYAVIRVLWVVARVLLGYFGWL